MASKKPTKRSSKVRTSKRSEKSGRPTLKKTPTEALQKQQLTKLCICHSLVSEVSTDAQELRGKVFKYQLMYGTYPGFAFKDYNNTQSVQMIRQAMASLSSVSGAKFTESNSKPDIRFYFMKTVQYNALGVYMGNGKVYLSQTRPVNPTVINCLIQHEVGHFLNIKASPPADKWGHCADIKCILNINGTAKTWCAKCKAIMVSKYGKT